MSASQSGSEYWIDALSDKVVVDSIVNHTKKIMLGGVDMRRERSEQARQAPNY